MYNEDSSLKVNFLLFTCSPSPGYLFWLTNTLFWFLVYFFKIIYLIKAYYQLSIETHKRSQVHVSWLKACTEPFDLVFLLVFMHKTVHVMMPSLFQVNKRNNVLSFEPWSGFLTTICQG